MSQLYRSPAASNMRPGTSIFHSLDPGPMQQTMQERMLKENFSKPTYVQRFNPHTDILLQETGELMPDAREALDVLKDRVALRQYDGSRIAERGWHIRTESNWRPLGVRIPRSLEEPEKMIGLPFLIAILMPLGSATY